MPRKATEDEIRRYFGEPTRADEKLKTVIAVIVLVVWFLPPLALVTAYLLKQMM